MDKRRGYRLKAEMTRGGMRFSSRDIWIKRDEKGNGRLLAQIWTLEEVIDISSPLPPVAADEE